MRERWYHLGTYGAYLWTNKPSDTHFSCSPLASVIALPWNDCSCGSLLSFFSWLCIVSHLVLNPLPSLMLNVEELSIIFGSHIMEADQSFSCGSVMAWSQRFRVYNLCARAIPYRILSESLSTRPAWLSGTACHSYNVMTRSLVRFGEWAFFCDFSTIYHNFLKLACWIRIGIFIRHQIDTITTLMHVQPSAFKRPAYQLYVALIGLIIGQVMAKIWIFERSVIPVVTYPGQLFLDQWCIYFFDILLKWDTSRGSGNTDAVATQSTSIDFQLSRLFLARLTGFIHRDYLTQCLLVQIKITVTWDSRRSTARTRQRTAKVKP